MLHVVPSELILLIGKLEKKMVSYQRQFRAMLVSFIVGALAFLICYGLVPYVEFSGIEDHYQPGLYFSIVVGIVIFSMQNIILLRGSIRRDS